MPPPLFLLLITTAAIIRGQNTITIPFPTCPPPTTCGNHTNISYPFFSYTHSRPTSFCGYQSFAVHCPNNTPFLPLVDTDNHLVITSIDYASRTLSLSDPAAAFTRCPDLPGSLRPISQLLTPTPTDAVLTFFLNCTRRPDVLAEAGGGPVPCLKSGGNFSYLFAGQYVPKAGWPCSEVLPMPATKSVVDYIFTTSAEEPPDVGRVMREGFQLEWPEVGPGECGECERSGGRCGYQQSGSGGGGNGAVFGCYCGDGDGWRTRVCGKKMKTKGIIIGMTVTAGILLISILCFIGYWRHYRRQQKQQRSPSSVLLTYPSSTTRLPFSDKDKELTVYPYQIPIFTYDELLEATNSFSTSMEIGNGGFGTVYKGMLRDGRTVAVKRLYESNFRRAEQFANEIVILSRLRHHNLVTLYGCSSPRSRELLLIYEFVPNGTVADHLFGPRTAEGRLQWPHRLSVAVETAAALAYLHSVDPPIIHRDVKTGNILLDAEFHVKVADFGLSRHFPRNGATHISTAPLGTPGYLDPEYHRSYKLTDRSDVYSFGVVLAELISSKPAVDLGRDPAEINLSTMAVNRIQSGYLEDLIDRKLGYESDVKTTTTMRLVAELAFRCLQADREMRPAMKEVLGVLEGLQEGATIGSEKTGHFFEQVVDNAGGDKGTGKERLVSPESVTEKWGSRSTTPGCSH